MRAVRRCGLPTADAVWLDAEGEILGGAPAIIMRRVDAASPTIQYLQAGVYVAADAATRRRMVEGLIGFAARLHALPLDQLNLESLARRGGAGHFIDREIRWAQAELHARFPPVETGERAGLHTEIRATLDAVALRLGAIAPRARRPVLAHGDLTLANVMFDREGAVAAVLDWELCHEGLGEADVAYFLHAARAIASLGDAVASVPPDEDVIAMYRAAGGAVSDWDFASALAAFRLATWGAIGMRRMPPQFWGAQKQMWILQRDQLLAALGSAEGAGGAPPK
jgi:aminoglycoside phosphotransferase (APT) family kinase protein